MRKIYDVITIGFLFMSPFAALMVPYAESIGIFLLLSNIFCAPAFYLLDVYYYKTKHKLSGLIFLFFAFVLILSVALIFGRLADGYWRFFPESGNNDGTLTFLLFGLSAIMFGLLISSIFVFLRDEFIWKNSRR